RRYLRGEPIRGTRELSVGQYVREHRADLGYSLRVYTAQTVNRLRKLLGLRERPYSLTVPRAQECEGLLLLGDPGTGKSQVIHQLLDRIKERNPKEAIICYDPAGEFTEKHFNPKTDIILNPLDTRCPYWAPYLELAGANDQITAPVRQFIAQSFFPSSDQVSSNNAFFSRSPCSLFAHALSLNPTSEQLVQLLTNEKLIGKYVTSTEPGQLIKKRAKDQRGVEMATFT